MCVMCTPHAIIARGKHIQVPLLYQNHNVHATRPYRSAKAKIPVIDNTCSVWLQFVVQVSFLHAAYIIKIIKESKIYIIELYCCILYIL